MLLMIPQIAWASAYVAGPPGPGSSGEPVHGSRLRARGADGDQLPRQRGRAVGRGQSGQPQQSHRGLAAGPLVQRRLARQRGRGQLRRRSRRGRRRAETKNSLCTGGTADERRRLRARLRPMGDHLAQRHRLPDEPLGRSATPSSVFGSNPDAMLRQQVDRRRDAPGAIRPRSSATPTPTALTTRTR